MIRSMTGFGREQAVINGREIIAEIRSVNHKFFEFSSKLPRNYQYLEPKLKTMLKEKITRGKVELSLLVYNIDVKDTSVKVNEQVASQYIEAIRTIAPDLGITDDLSASDLFRIPDVFTVIKEETDEEQLWADISSVVGSALDKFIAMRETEGAALKADVRYTRPKAPPHTERSLRTSSKRYSAHRILTSREYSPRRLYSPKRQPLTKKRYVCTHTFHSCAQCSTATRR